MKLPIEYYKQSDVLFLGKDLLGKLLMTNIDGALTGGVITETESYLGFEDRASHAYGGRRTKRNEVMYAEGGVAYVFRCYGVHALFNVVTNQKEIPHAILIRSLKPLIGIDEMLLRRNKKKLDKTLTSGPGNLTRALGIDTLHNGISLDSDLIWIEKQDLTVLNKNIKFTPRIGIDYAGEDAFKPWRFVYEESA